MSIKSVAIIGCGWLGQIAGRKMSEHGLDVIGSTTNPEKREELNTNHIRPIVFRARPDRLDGASPELFETDAMLISIPPGRAHNAAEEYPRIIARILERIPPGKKTRIIFISSTAVYPDVDGPVSEQTEPAPSRTTGKAVLLAEREVISHDSSSIIFRMAGLVGKNRHPGRFLINKKDAGNPNKRVNLIHGEDAANAIYYALRHLEMSGIYNVCSLKHPSREEFYARAAISIGLARPYFNSEDNATGKIIESSRIRRETSLQFIYDNPMDMFEKGALC